VSRYPGGKAVAKRPWESLGGVTLPAPLPSDLARVSAPQARPLKHGFSSQQQSPALSPSAAGQRERQRREGDIRREFSLRISL